MPYCCDHRFVFFFGTALHGTLASCLCFVVHNLSLLTLLNTDNDQALIIDQIRPRVWAGLQDPGFAQQCATTWTQMRRGERSDSSVTGRSDACTLVATATALLCNTTDPFEHSHCQRLLLSCRTQALFSSVQSLGPRCAVVNDQTVA